MEEYNLTCIRCPMGCSLHVSVAGDEVTVTGNTCPRGADYGRQEVTAPVRTVTSTVPVTGGQIPVVSVKTAGDVPKDSIFDLGIGSGKDRRCHRPECGRNRNRCDRYQGCRN